MVFMLSTCHQPDMQEVGKDRNGNEIFKPTIIRDYNIHMGGVDRVDYEERR